MGNGTGISIFHSGNTDLQSPSSTFVLHLKNILHASLIKRNLMSVSKCAQDNNVFFELHPHMCLVKYQDTKHILLKGTIKDGLYAFDNL